MSDFVKYIPRSGGLFLIHKYSHYWSPLNKISSNNELTFGELDKDWCSIFGLDGKLLGALLPMPYRGITDNIVTTNISTGLHELQGEKKSKSEEGSGLASDKIVDHLLPNGLSAISYNSLIFQSFSRQPLIAPTFSSLAAGWLCVVVFNGHALGALIEISNRVVSDNLFYYFIGEMTGSNKCDELSDSSQKSDDVGGTRSLKRKHTPSSANSSLERSSKPAKRARTDISCEGLDVTDEESESDASVVVTPPRKRHCDGELGALKSSELKEISSTVSKMLQYLLELTHEKEMEENFDN